MNESDVVGACCVCHRAITLRAAREEPAEGGHRFTIREDGSWECLHHSYPCGHRGCFPDMCMA